MKDRRWLDYAILASQIGSIGLVIFGYLNYNTPVNAAKEVQIEHRLSSLEEQVKRISDIDNRTTHIEEMVIKLLDRRKQ